MWHWHDARYPRDNPGRVSAENDSVERMAGSFLNPQNFAITIGKPFWRLVGAVFVGGALRGGAQLVQLEAAQAGGIGQMAGGIAATGSQATQQRLGRALDT